MSDFFGRKRLTEYFTGKVSDLNYYCTEKKKNVTPSNVADLINCLENQEKMRLSGFTLSGAPVKRLLNQIETDIKIDAPKDGGTEFLCNGVVSDADYGNNHEKADEQGYKPPNSLRCPLLIFKHKEKPERKEEEEHKEIGSGQYPEAEENSRNEKE